MKLTSGSAITALNFTAPMNLKLFLQSFPVTGAFFLTLRRLSAVAGYLVFCTCILHALTAPSAQAASGQEAATAEALFREAQSLLEAKNYDEACPKFQASQTLDPQLGTLLNLARCHEIAGKTASAWAEFLQAASIARRAGEDRREEVAQKHAEQLEERLVRIKLVVSKEAQVEGLVVTLDEAVQSAASYGTPTPIDPGTLLLTVSAPGYDAWSEELRFDAEGVVTEVLIPVLIKTVTEPVQELPAIEKVEAPKEEKQVVPAMEMRRGTTWIPGLVVTGVGVAGLAVGSAFGILAIKRWNKADCEGGFCPSQQAQNDAKKAKDFATVSTVGLITGGILAAGGITLLILPSSKYQPRSQVAGSQHRSELQFMEQYAALRLVPSAASADLGLSLSGDF